MRSKGANYQPRNISPWYDSTVNTGVTILGAIQLFIFPVMVGIGIGVGILWSVWPVAAFPDLARSRFEVSAIALASAVIGGRIGYVLVNWAYFQKNITEIPQIWAGGLSWAGAVTSGIFAILITARIRRTSFGELADGLRPLLTSIAVSAWLASWMTGFAYGIAVDTWWGVPARNEWGFMARRWPVQLVGAFSALGFHWASDQLQVRKWRRKPGLAACLELGGLFITISGLTPFRADPAPQWGGIRIDAWAAITLVILCALAAFRLSARTNNMQKKLEPGDYEG